MPHIKQCKIWGDTTHSHTYSTQAMHTHTHTKGRLHVHTTTALCDQCVLSACASKTCDEGKALFSLGSEQPPKTNNYIQQIVYMHQSAHTQKKLKHLSARYRANQYFSSPALIVHAGHERANEAKLQRQCSHQSRLSAKGQNYLSHRLDQSCSAQEEMLLKWTTRDLPLHDSLWVGISVWESTDVILTPHMLFVVSALWIALYAGNAVCK